MINHVRTLLLNQSGDNQPGFGFPGEEIVPEEFRALILPRHLRSIWQRLFGSNPDRAFINFRLRQYLTLLHGSDLAEYVSAPDSRITYWPNHDPDYHDNFKVTVRQLPNQEPKELTIVGTLEPDEKNGKIRHLWTVTVVDGNTIQVRRDTPPIVQNILNYTITDNLSSLVPLIGSNLQFRFAAGVDSIWLIEGLARPWSNLGDVLSKVTDSISESDLVRLFGAKLVEPYLTFRNLWIDHPQGVYRLMGLLLALIYRLDELYRKV